MSPEKNTNTRPLDKSIHPRNWMVGTGVVKNTSKPWKGKGKLAKRHQRLHRRRMAHAATLKSLSAKILPTAFKQPGSYNQHK